jgi:soluble lytic murein transglycosylase
MSIFLCADKIPIEAKKVYIDISIISKGSVAPPSLFLAIAAAESRYSPTARSPVGAYGIFQIMPIAERHVNQRLGTTLDREIPLDNIILGVAYIEELYSMAEGDIPRMLAMYNWGPYSLTKWEKQHGKLTKRTQHRLPLETYNYIKRVTNYMQLQKECE